MEKDVHLHLTIKPSRTIMKKKLHIAISSPCHEKWSDFTPTHHGGFCGSCQKEVIDFTSWSDEKIKEYFRNKPTNTCGRFQQQQLKTYSYSSPRYVPTWIPATLMSVLSLAAQEYAIAQPNDKNHTDQFQNDQHEPFSPINSSSDSILIKGKVTDRLDTSALPGVNVVLKGTTIGTVTNEYGEFQLLISSTTPNDTLVFSFIGLMTEERKINPLDNPVVNVSMEGDIKGGIQIVVGGVVSYRWYHPRSLWW